MESAVYRLSRGEGMDGRLGEWMMARRETSTIREMTADAVRPRPTWSFFSALPPSLKLWRTRALGLERFIFERLGQTSPPGEGM